MSVSHFGSLRNAGFALAAILIAAGCNGGNGNGLTPAASQPMVSSTGVATSGASPDTSLLKQLTKQVVIGSTIDPRNGAGNPYGLTISPITSGILAKGDLVVCNFNAKSGKQGTGKSIVALHPAPGSTPTHVSSDKTLVGCDA